MDKQILITADLIQKYNSNPQQKSRNRRVEITFLAPRGGGPYRGTGEDTEDK